MCSLYSDFDYKPPPHPQFSVCYKNSQGSQLCAGKRLPQCAKTSSHRTHRSLCMQIITLPPTTPLLLRLKPRLLTLVSTLMMTTSSPSPSLLKMKLQWPLCAQLSAASAPFHMQFLLLLPQGVHMAGSSFSAGFRSKDTCLEQPRPGDSKLYLVTLPPFSPFRCFPDSTYH